MPDYSVDGNQNAAAAITILNTTRGASKKHGWKYVNLGSAATPADQANNLQVNRTTVAALGTAVTPRPLDPDEAAAVTTGIENATTEPTKTADLVLLSFSHNSRANFQWFANPFKNILAPDVSANGLALVFVVATGTQLFEATVHIEE